MQAGLDGALFGAGGVTVGQSLESPLVVLEVVSVLGLLFMTTVSGSRAVSRIEAQADLRNSGSYLLYSATLPGE